MLFQVTARPVRVVLLAPCPRAQESSNGSCNRKQVQCRGRRSVESAPLRLTLTAATPPNGASTLRNIALPRPIKHPGTENILGLATPHVQFSLLASPHLDFVMLGTSVNFAPIEMTMGIEVEHNKGIVTVTLSGVLNETAYATTNALAAIALKPNARVIIDLSGLHFLGSFGLSVLVDTVTRSRRNGGRSLFRNPTPNVRDIFEVTRLNNFFEIFGNAAAAEAALMK